MNRTSIIILSAIVFSVMGCTKNCCPNKCESGKDMCKPQEKNLETSINKNMHSLNNDDQKIIHACALTSKEQRKRMEKLGKSIFKDAQVVELEDGLELIFIQPSSYTEKLIEFINFERQCCRSFTFQLVFKPDQGPIHLTMIGGKELKEQMLTGLREYGHS